MTPGGPGAERARKGPSLHCPHSPPQVPCSSVLVKGRMRVVAQHRHGAKASCLPPCFTLSVLSTPAFQDGRFLAGEEKKLRAYRMTHHLLHSTPETSLVQLSMGQAHRGCDKPEPVSSPLTRGEDVSEQAWGSGGEARGCQSS